MYLRISKISFVGFVMIFCGTLEFRISPIISNQQFSIKWFILKIIFLLFFQSSIRNTFTNYTISMNEELVFVDMKIESDHSHFPISMKNLHFLYCSLTFDLTTMHGKNYQNFFDKTYDYCTFLLKLPNEFLMLLVHGELSKSGQWMHKCPIEQVLFFLCVEMYERIKYKSNDNYLLFQKLYKASNFTLNVERFPLFTPEAKYNVTLIWSTKLKEEIIQLAAISVLGRLRVRLK